LPWGSICKIIGCHPSFDLNELLDVRPALEYAQGHIAGARSNPVDELESRLHELPPEQRMSSTCH
jgi:rhodanese-related sulfurtransferase